MGVDSAPESPQTIYQLLYNPSETGSACFIKKEWTQEEFDDWEKSGYRKQDGHFTEYGLYDTAEERDEAIKEHFRKEKKQEEA